MLTLRSSRYRVRGLIASLIMAALACTLLVLPSAAPAQAATLGTAYPRGFDCVVLAGAGRQVRAYPPTMTSITGYTETVYWSPDLYRWNGSSWALYDNSKPWFNASADLNGTHYQWTRGSTWFWPNGNPVNYAAYNNLPAGSYAVKDYYMWSNGWQSSAWSPYLGGGSSCTFS
jgi:hypothetical protein